MPGLEYLAGADRVAARCLLMIMREQAVAVGVAVAVRRGRGSCVAHTGQRAYFHQMIG